MPKQQLSQAPIKHTYRVSGTFSYMEYCPRSYSSDECAHCEGHETIKTISVEQDEYSADLAAKSVIEEQGMYYVDACWLVGYPSVKYLHSEFNLHDFWNRKQIEQNAIRKTIKEA